MQSEFSFLYLKEMWDAFRRSGYEFKQFPTELASAQKMSEQAVVLLRHDIDFCPDKAVEMAEFEARLGISSTYFFLLSTEFYNLFDGKSQAKVQQISSLGHSVGLHFDRMTYPKAQDPRSLESCIRKEMAILADWSQKKISHVSFHRPEPRLYNGEWHFSKDLIHTYLPEFTKNMSYISDSRGTWGHGTPLEQKAFHARKAIQILIHPVWWNQVPQAPLASLQDFLKRRSDQLSRAMEQNCTVYKHEGNS